MHHGLACRSTRPPFAGRVSRDDLLLAAGLLLFLTHVLRLGEAACSSGTRVPAPAVHRDLDLLVGTCARRRRPRWSLQQHDSRLVHDYPGKSTSRHGETPLQRLKTQQKAGATRLKKERKKTQDTTHKAQGRDGRTARRHQTGILRRAAPLMRGNWF